MSSQRPDALTGTVLAGRYDLGEAIGSGGMSVVFAAHDRRLNRPVAVKIIRANEGASPDLEELRARLRREAAAAARIPPHPNVVQVFDYGTDPEQGIDFIVMELLQGEDLKARLRAGPVSLAEAIPLLLQAARGVAAGHRAGVVHRDVKPANLFLSTAPGSEPVVRVLDFGIAKPMQVLAEEDLTVAGMVPLSPAYASPEQRSPEPVEITPASDVYQLGLTGYEVLAGERPFTEQERAQLARGAEVRLQAHGRWLQVPAEVRAVFRQALEPRPDARFPDAAAFAEALALAVQPAEPARSGGSAGLSPAAGAMRSVPARRSTRLPLRYAGGGLLLLLALWGIRALLGGSDDDEAVPVAAAPAVVSAAQRSPQIAGAANSDPAADRGDATEGVMLSAAAARAETAEVLKRAVVDLNQAWVEGDLKRHVGHYASRVDYYNSHRLARSGVRRDRLRDLRRYDVNRNIRIDNQRVEFLENDRARVLVEKSWSFQSEDQTRTGRGIQEYIFKRDADDGEWYVVSEQLLDKSERSVVQPAPDR